MKKRSMDNKMNLRFFFLICIMSVSCQSRRNSSAENDSIVVPLKDSALVQKMDTTLSNLSPDLSDIYHAYLERYRDTITIDSTITVKQHKVVISLRHYCLHDSALSLPDKYTRIYGINGFVTHNFESSLSVWVDGKRVLDTVITKHAFEDGLPDELKKYGVLSSPVISLGQNNEPSVDHSLSIPLTDVGRLVSFTIHNNKID